MHIRFIALGIGAALAAILAVPIDAGAASSSTSESTTSMVRTVGSVELTTGTVSADSSTEVDCYDYAHATTPYRSGDYIVANNNFRSCSRAPLTNARIVLQRWRGFYWQTLSTRTLYYWDFFPQNVNIVRNAVHWYCRGAGTYTYRVFIDSIQTRFAQLPDNFGPQGRGSC
jgi:hypothetical protein